MENYTKVCSTTIDGDLPLVKYKSSKTGITVCVSEYDGPLVNGYLCVATEASDDDGLPHTLEHLVFMGSEDYPYKGILDQLANRCLASGTNAWTDTDHTCYTMTTAGSEGFLNLLPIYIDHVLYPLLTEAAYITEVHHVTGEGEDAGVVYCEMQARENMGESLCMLNMLRAMYPGNCGYRYETGGLMKNLRESTTNKKVRSYHRAFYRPENLCIIVTGSVKPEQVLKAIEPMELKVIKKGPRTPFTKPWQTPVPPLGNGTDMVVQYPCDDNDHGLCYIAYRGPPVHSFQDVVAIMILQDYLSDTSVSPLQKFFVESEDPYCCTVKGGFLENIETCFYFVFENVYKQKLLRMKDALTTVLANLHKDPNAISMDRMATVIERRKLRILNQMESAPHETIAGCVIQDFLYGRSLEDLQSRMCQIPTCTALLNKDQKFWTDLLKTYMIDNKIVTVLGEPSPTLLAKLTEKETQRIQYQRDFLKEEGLQKRAEALEKAIELNEVDPPKEMIQAVVVPKLSSISYHTVIRSCNEINPNAIPQFDLSGLPFRFELDNIKTNFVSITIIMNTSDLTADLRLYVPLFLELLLESAVVTKQGKLSHDVVVHQLEADTVHVGTALGFENGQRFFSGSHAQCVVLFMLVDNKKYSKAVQWCHDLIVGIQFEVDRIQVVANKMVKDVVKKRRSGLKVTGTMIRNLCFSSPSNQVAASMVRQQAFLQTVLDALKKNPDSIVAKLKALRESLSKAESITVHMSANVTPLCALGDLKACWQSSLSAPARKPVKSKELVQCYSLLLGSEASVPRDIIVGVGSVESAFLMQCTQSLNSYTSPDLAAMLVLTQYLTQLEGPMWRQIRGQGLAYSYNLYVKPCEGLLYLVLTKSSVVGTAYKEALNIIQRHLNEEEEWDDEMLESSKSSLMFEQIEREKTVSDVALQSLLAYRRGYDMNYTKMLLEQISRVKVDDMVRVGKLYLAPLFDPNKSRLAICCHPSKVHDTVTQFAEMSRKLVVIPSLEDSFLAKF
ncbi:uncharacterized protein C05D11.1-like [Ornithodoros turicata]|uniref:uncharacterized protein C05D11.1-like n=1 Tax=Ornithodoros turicata TaxID=34597 RepID=UPI0031398A03